MLVFELFFGYLSVTFGEVVCIVLHQIIDLIANLFAIAKSLGVDIYCELLVKDIVLQLKECLHELFLYLEGSNVVNFSICIEPFQVSVEACESSSPVCSIFELILDLRESLCIDFDDGLSLGHWIHYCDGLFIGCQFLLSF